MPCRRLHFEACIVLNYDCYCSYGGYVTETLQSPNKKNAHDYDDRSHLARPRTGPVNKSSQAFYDVSYFTQNIPFCIFLS